MIVDVLLMRYQGRRLPWREIDQGKVFRGELRTVCPPGSDRPSAAFLIKQGGIADHLLPDLHEPAFTGVGQDVFHLRGVERLELATGAHAVVQEWRCRPVKEMLPP